MINSIEDLQFLTNELGLEMLSAILCPGYENYIPLPGCSALALLKYKSYTRYVSIGSSYKNVLFCLGDLLKIFIIAEAYKKYQHTNKSCVCRRHNGISFVCVTLQNLANEKDLNMKKGYGC